ncbi:MAG: hypothetical protein H0T62_05175 [Parachlamydiaceae bacterium]|nr:hypothetical protein [Parachlamydiaceae bacterium]
MLHQTYGKRNEINEDFLKQFGINPKVLYNNEIKSITPELKDVTWAKCSIIHKSTFLNNFVRNVSATACGLKKSCWAPNKGVNTLIGELKENGPLCVAGYLGKLFYKDAPFIMKQKYSGRDVYAWRPGAERIPPTYLAHTVLLVGAKKVEDKAYVFFIDSQDCSDPIDKSQQKIYLISLSNLTENIRDLRGFPKEDSPFGYAYYGNFNL